MINTWCVVGTRPEALKMIPLIYALRAHPEFHCRVIATAQHRDMLDQVFNLFQIQSDIDLNIMQANQTLNLLAGRLLIGLEEVLKKEKPHIILAQGDTTTVLATALSAFHLRIPFGHIEAGLRTGNPNNPFPEEMNRVLAGRIAQWHFAPTENARQNLLAEGIMPQKIFLTGNTIVDMIRIVDSRNSLLPFSIDSHKKLILVTAHRRENFGEPLYEIFRSIREIADRYSDIQIVYPVHPNPNVETPAHKLLNGHPRIILCKPLDYIVFTQLMKKSYFIMSDSGGIQEEAISLGKPVLLLRRETERPEGVALGGVILVGHDKEKIMSESSRLLEDSAFYQQTSTVASPYGDGYSAEKIVRVLQEYFELKQSCHPIDS